MFSTNAAADMAVIATIDPATVANTEVFTDVIDITRWDQVVATCLLGNMASETIDFKCYTCASDGSGAVLLKACTQLAAHASNNDNTQLVMNVRDVELNAARYIKFGLVTGGASGGPAAVVVHGVDAKNEPATANDLASVTQIKF